MRPFEALLIVLLLVGVGLSARGRSNLGRMRETLAILTLVFMGAQLFVEGYRWQMLPAYIVAVELAAVAALNAKAGPKLPRMVAAIGRILAGIAVLVSGFLAWAFPIPDLPKPSGKYAVGTTTAYLKDETREEIYTDAIGDRREIMAQVWYPAEPAPDAAPSAWVSNASVIGPAIARWVNLPPFLFDHINLVRSNSHVDAPIASTSPYPVLLYSHGWGGFRQINQNQLEQLASLGYVVVAVDHTYGAIVTEFPDGRIVANKGSILPPSGSPDFAPRFAELAKVYAQDLRFTMNELERANIGDGPFGVGFRGRLDLGKVGFFGHSTGGAAVFQACGFDPRCKAVVAQDPVTTGVAPAITDRGLTQPSLTFFSDDWLNTPNDKRTVSMLNAGTADGYRVPIAGAAHYDFVMTPFFSPLASAVKLKGPIPSETVVGLIDAYQDAFFERYLRGLPSPLLTGESRPYAEAGFEKVK